MRERLARRALWWKHYHTFTFAHHPLCERHRPNVLRIRSVHICRSCTMLWAGVAASLFCATAPLVALHVALWPTLLLSFPTVYANLGRRFRDVVRFGAGFAGGAALTLFVTTLTTSPWIALGHAALIATLYVLYASLRKRRSARICGGCPELEQPGICSGFRGQAEHVRAFEDAIYRRCIDRIEVATGVERRTSTSVAGAAVGASGHPTEV